MSLNNIGVVIYGIVCGFICVFLSASGTKSAFSTRSLTQFFKRVNQLNNNRHQSRCTNLDQLVLFENYILGTMCHAVKRTNQVAAISAVNNTDTICETKRRLGQTRPRIHIKSNRILLTTLTNHLRSAFHLEIDLGDNILRTRIRRRCRNVKPSIVKVIIQHLIIVHDGIRFI
jgi:hypothetical protein